MAPFFNGGYTAITFLASNLNLPVIDIATLSNLEHGNLACQINADIASAKTDNTWSFSIRIADLILMYSEQNYKKYFTKACGYFGQGSATWKKQFIEYQSQFLKDMEDAIVKTDQYSQEELMICSKLMLKLTAFIKHGAFNGSSGVPILDGMVPLFCPSFMNDLLAMGTCLETPLMLVSSLSSLI